MTATTLTLHAYDWKEDKIYEDDDTGALHAWCLNRDSVPCLLRLSPPIFCHLELPFFVRGKLYRWDDRSVPDFLEAVKKRAGRNAPISCSRLRYKKKTYYYRGDRGYPMVTLSFTTKDSMQEFSRLFHNPIMLDGYGVVKCNVWESRIPLARKLLTMQRIRFSGWFTVSAIKVEEEMRISTLAEEYMGDFRTMHPVPKAECQSWLTYPTFLSFDIECYSHNERAFPDSYNALDVVYMISCLFQRYKRPDTLQRYLLILGDCHPIPDSQVQGVKLIKCNSEVELIEAFADLVSRLDPDILSGYNILGFDYSYLHNRLERHLLEWKPMGRLIGKSAYFTRKTWSSGAYGHNQLNTLHMDGRISLDLLPIIKRDYKFKHYDLDSVSRYFLKEGKHPIKAQEIFRAYRELQENPTEQALQRMTQIAAYCVQDAGLVIRLGERINVWENLVMMSNVNGVNIFKLFTSGQQARCYSLLYDLASREGHVLDERDVPGYKFTGGEVQTPDTGLHENIICLDFTSLYPSIIQELNICYTTLIPPDMDDQVPDSDCNIVDFEQEEEEVQEREEDPSLPEIVGEAPPAPTATKKVHYRFRYYNRKEGLLPRLVRKLVTKRRAVRAQLAKETDPVMKVVLNILQNALKVTANSFFGFLGVHGGGMMPLIEGAMSITARGRILIGMVNRHVQSKVFDTPQGQKNGKIVYGDTDSSMADLHIQDSKQCHAIGTALTQEINGVPAKLGPNGEVLEPAKPGLFRHPLQMEFEKSMRILLLKRKKYAYLLIDKNGEFRKAGDDLEIGKKGIVLARRDNCPFLYDIYNQVLTCALKREPLTKAFALIIDALSSIFRREVPYTSFLTVRELGASYKNQSYFLNVFAERLRREGKPVLPGDRLEFIIVQKEADLLGDKMLLTEEYLDSLSTDSPYEIDYNYYVEKALLNPLDQLFSISYSKELTSLAGLGFKPTNRHKLIGCDQPVKLALKFHERGYDILTLKAMVCANLNARPRLLIEPAPEAPLQDPTPRRRRLNIVQ